MFLVRLTIIVIEERVWDSQREESLTGKVNVTYLTGNLKSDVTYLTLFNIFFPSVSAISSMTFCQTILQFLPPQMQIFSCSIPSRCCMVSVKTHARNEKYKFMNINSQIWIHQTSERKRKMWLLAGLLAPRQLGSPIAVHSQSIIFMGHYSSKENIHTMWELAMCSSL